MFSRDELKHLNLYFGRPAKELIFVTSSEHRKIHSEDNVKGGKKTAKPIIQYTKAGEFVSEWESASEVQRQLGIKQGSISYCCRGGLKSAGGFVWSFK